MKAQKINISAPNLVNACVDQVTEVGIHGRLYSCYAQDPVKFENEVQLLKAMEKLMDDLDYPQRSMKSRSYAETEQPVKKEKPQKVVDAETMLAHRGELGTLILHVQYRQNATWQGRMIDAVTGDTEEFFSALELLKLIDNRMQ